MSSSPTKMVLESSDSEDLPDTQPMDSQDPDFDVSKESKEEEDVWGQLFPYCGTFPRIPLKTDSFTFGRVTGDYLIKESDIGEDYIKSISSVQCEILKNKDGVFLKDFSTNGTYVNGRKVGKGMTYPMAPDSEISFASPMRKAFVFVSNLEVQQTFPPEFTSKFTMGRVLGTGASGEVRLAYRVTDMHRVAVKIIQKPPTSPFACYRGPSSEQLLREVEILRSVDHPNIISLEKIIETADYLYIVLELAEGGELKKMIGKEELNESLAKMYFQQMADAIDYLHSRQICHRDLKLENILICSEDENNPIIKISDMGLSKFVDQTMLKTICGTRAYLAPEVLDAACSLETMNYTVKVDCWALGVILYELLFGKKPFSEERNTKVSLNEQIRTADYVFPPKAEMFSREALDLIQKLLIVDPSRRLSSRDVLCHAWLKARKRLAEEVEDSAKSRKIGEWKS